MSVLATRIHGTRLPGDHYRCQRCGGEFKYNVCRGPRPTLCGDCHEVELTIIKLGTQP